MSLPRITIYLVSVLLLLACASERYRARQMAARAHRHHPGLSARARLPPPPWVQRLPVSPGTHFFLGESMESMEEEASLERAWVSALVRIGMTEFPELAVVSSRSVENLKAARSERKFAMDLARVDWSGLHEATEQGSPYIDYSPETGKFTVFRLLRWSEPDMRRAHERVREAKVHALPFAPERVRREEKRMADAIGELHSLSYKAARRNELVGKVMSEVKCGVTIADLIRVLGSPDSYNPFNRLEHEYFWGQYKVEQVADEPIVAAITKEDGRSARRMLCRKSLPD